MDKIREINELVQNLDTIVEEHKSNPDNRYLDCSWIAVVYIGKDWRFAKKAGCKKDSYWKWILYSTSTQDASSLLAEKISNAIANHDDFCIRQRYL